MRRESERIVAKGGVRNDHMPITAGEKGGRNGERVAKVKERGRVEVEERERESRRKYGQQTPTPTPSDREVQREKEGKRDI